MSSEEKRHLPSPIAVLIALLFVGVLGLMLAEFQHRRLEAKEAAEGRLDERYQESRQALKGYASWREGILRHRYLYGGLALVSLVGLFIGAKTLSRLSHDMRERISGMFFKRESYALKRKRFCLGTFIEKNPDPGNQVVLGADAKGKPVYLEDASRSMHVHCLGQTGSGKTRSVIEPLLLQDIRRGKGVLLVDGKGAAESEDSLLAMAAYARRLDAVKVFTLNPFRPSATYNPLHLSTSAGVDPRAMGERVFSTFADDMPEPYYREQARMFFLNLICALASTGKRFHMQDVWAATASSPILEHLYDLASDKRATRALAAQIAQLGDGAQKALTGLLAAVGRYDSPLVNVYEPDIVLEDDIDKGRIVAFHLPSNYKKQLARYLGVSVFQHLQQVGALRQLDRSRSQTPLYVYADEFYSFAYEGFTDCVNKLRDAEISILLSHQTLSDLEKVSPAFTRGIWDNTRNKIVLYQADPEICERLAKALGTEKDEELTVRRSVDGFLNPISTLEASSREVDGYRLHPNRIKSLLTGQAYLATGSEFVGVNLGMAPKLPPAPGRPKRREPRAEEDAEIGVGLYRMFVEGVGTGKKGRSE